MYKDYKKNESANRFDTLKVYTIFIHSISIATYKTYLS